MKDRKQVSSEKFSTKKCSELLNDYILLDSLANVVKRIKANEYKSFIYIFLVAITANLIVWPISFLLFDDNYIGSVVIWIVLIFLDIICVVYTWGKPDKYINEMVRSREVAFCELVKKYGINQNNINNIIEYFALGVESTKSVYIENRALKSISNGTSQMVYLATGALLSKYLSAKSIIMFTFSLISLIIITSLIKLFMYFTREEKYIDNTKALILELKRFEILNKII